MDWLQPFLNDLDKALVKPDVSLREIAIQLVASLVFGLLVALTARFGRREPGAHDTFPITLVMLCVLLTLVTRVVGDNTALAFSLVGALSIVRFRTVVRDTQDTAFVMLAVVVGMGIGAGHLWPATTLGLVIVFIAVTIARFTPLLSPPHVSESQIKLRVGIAAKPEELLGGVFAECLERQHLMSAETARQGTMLELTYRIRLKPGLDAVALLAQLNRLPGVESVEWHERAGEP